MSDQPQYPTSPDYQQQQPQYPQYPPQATPKKGGMGKWIALGGCGCLFFIAVIAGVVYFVFEMTKAPMQAVNDHLAALRNNNVEQAYNNCSSGFRQETSLQQFQGFLGGYPFFKTAKEFTSSDRKAESGVTTFVGNVESSDGSKHPVEYRVIKESGAYKVHYIHVNEPASTSGEVAEPADEQEEPPTGSSEPEIFDVQVNKTQSGETVTVTVAFQVQGFHNGRSGSQYTLNLVQDLETLGPDGNKVGSLSADGIKTLTETGPMEYTSANFSNTLTIPVSYQHGTYTVKLRVHDQIGGGNAEESGTFEFP